jgi:hypothetical protein
VFKKQRQRMKFGPAKQINVHPYVDPWLAQFTKAIKEALNERPEYPALLSLIVFAAHQTEWAREHYPIHLKAKGEAGRRPSIGAPLSERIRVF